MDNLVIACHPWRSERRPGRHAFALLVAGMMATAPLLADAALPSEKIVNMSLAQLRLALDDGALTSAELVDAYMDKIETEDRRPGGIRAVIALNQEARSQAREWDRQRAQQGGGVRNAPLAGIPFLAKDNFDAVGLPNTGGSIVLSTSMPNNNAHAVQKLLDQGAILLGKTNLSELAASYGWYGYSSVGGQTINPFNPLRTADGSSSGSAAAVAARFAPFALGTDTTGSIRSPASVTGTVGMRPTLGLVSRSGIIPMSLTADTAGAITRSVEDQAIVLDAIQGEDKQDAATVGVSRPAAPLVAAVKGSTLSGTIIAVVDNFDGANEQVDEVKRRAVVAMQQAGARIVHIRLPASYESLQPALLGPIGAAEFRPQMNAYLSGLPADQPHDLREFMARLGVLTGNGTHTINPGRYKGLKIDAETLKTDSPEYIRLLSVVIPELRRELTQLMTQGRYDALFYPTVACTAPPLPGMTDPSFVCKAYAYAAAKISPSSGFPEISVNGGWTADGLPVGVSFLGLAGDDAKLLGLAAAYERLGSGR